MTYLEEERRVEESMDINPLEDETDDNDVYVVSSIMKIFIIFLTCLNLLYYRSILSLLC